MAKQHATKLAKKSYQQALSMRKFVRKADDKPRELVNISNMKKEVQKTNLKRREQGKKVEIEMKNKVGDGKEEKINEDEKENKRMVEKIRVSRAMILEDPADENEYYKKLKALFHGQKYVLMPAKRL